ncbi:glycosyltransferase [Dokdonella sp.]|uniref:glycosyltransferase n=1 Tax=Dokdonella sp. TaxID=2291710 RepID=UPI001B1C7E63|nr:glycosyltransferase [Dokdonella sp.]MBO9664715.1 glycosyltransferase [Dokdonella sp.]
MHVTPIAAKPSAGDGMAERPSLEPAAPPLRVCVYAADTASPERLDALRERLPRAAAFTLLGTPAAAPGAQNLADDPLELLATAARAFPHEHLILVRADLDLPRFAGERLLRALDRPDVLGALPLTESSLDPDRSGVLRTAAEHAADAHRVDALCYAYSARRIDDDADFPDALPALSAWHGERLARLGADRLRERDALEAGGLRVVRLDHLYVETGAADAPAREAVVPSPLDPLREQVAAALAAGLAPAQPGLDAKPVLLHVLHGWGGGAERWVRDYAAADSAAHHLVLIARGRFKHRRHGEWLELHDGAMNGPPLRRWPLPRPIADTAIGDATYRRLLAGVLRDYGVDALIVSSLIGHSLDALRTSLPLYCIVHDHYPLWPILHRDFGDPAVAFDEAQRAADLAANGDDAEFAERDPRHWRRLRDATVAALREAEATLIAPSRSALANHLRLAPELGALPAHVIAHGLAPWPDGSPQPASPPPRERLRLLVPGRIRRGKGAELLRAAVPRLREHAELFLLGAGSDAHALFGEHGLHIVLDYRRDELPRLVGEIRPDAALLLPTVAETFSYALSEMRSLGLPVIATRVGALAERIEDGADGFLVDADVEAIVARVDALARRPDALAAVRARLAGLAPATTAEAARAYTTLLDLPPRAGVRYPLDSTDAASLHDAALAHTLAQLRERERDARAQLAVATAESARRGDWGHGLDRELSATHKRLKKLNDAHDALHEELKDRTDWALRLDSELQDVKPRYEQILASTSWRLTAPLRRANAGVRSLRASLAYRALHLRNIAGRVRGSLAQRGLAGTVKRIAQEFGRGGGPAPARVVYAEPSDDFAPFAVPSSTTPRVSIVIPVYNKIAYTVACLRSIAAHAGATAFEVIVVDDGSSDATPQRLAEIAGIRAQRNAENLGFIGSCNAGAAAARGDYLLFLNNDTVVTPGWLDALVRCLEQAPHAGLVGAKLVYPDGRLQEAGGIVFDDGSGWNYGRFEDPADARYGFRREVDYCSGAAILLGRDLFERLGAFDRRYAPAYYEDTDLAFAVRDAGLKVYYEPASTVVHFEGITSGTDLASGTKRYQVVNREKFQDKWKDALARQPAPGTPIGRAATHRAGKRVLIVDATTPTPDQDSGSLRMVNLMRVLADLGCQTSFLPDNRAWVERYTAELQELGVEALYGAHAADPIALLRERGREFDLIVLSRHYVAASYVGLVRLYAPQATLAFDTVDLHYLREQRAAELSGKPELARHAAATRAQELKLIRECDVTLVVSPVEQELLGKEAPGARVEVLSNVHEVYGCRRPFDARRDLVFVGGFQHPPNTDAVTWFVREVFPLVRAELPELNFHVIGSKVPDAIRALADEHVLVHGYIEDIAPYMDGCRISVAPLRYGAGVKGKVNMAMSYGMPVVATTAAVEGMYVRAGEDVLVADEAAAFAADVVRLYRDPALWKRLSANGLANVERHFSFSAAREALRQLLP